MSNPREKYHKAIQEMNQTNPIAKDFQEKVDAVTAAYKEWMESNIDTTTPKIWIARYWKIITPLLLIVGMIASIWGYLYLGGDPAGTQGIRRPEWFVIFSAVLWVSISLLYIRWARRL